MPSAGLDFVKFAALCSKMQMSLSDRICNVSVQDMVLYVGNCHFCVTQTSVALGSFGINGL